MLAIWALDGPGETPARRKPGLLVRLLGLADRRPGRTADRRADGTADNRARNCARGGLLFDGVAAGREGQSPGHQAGYDYKTGHRQSP